MVITIYTSTLTSLLMFPFYQFLFPRSCLSSLDISMKLNPTTNPDSQIQPLKISGIISAVGYIYLQYFLLE